SRPQPALALWFAFSRRWEDAPYIALQSLSPIRATARHSAFRPTSRISLLQRDFAPTRFGYFRLHTLQPQRPTVHPRHARAVKPPAVPHPLLARVQLGITRHDQPPSVGTLGLAQRPVPGLRGISRPATRTPLEPVQGPQARPSLVLSRII